MQRHYFLEKKILSKGTVVRYININDISVICLIGEKIFNFYLLLTSFGREYGFQ
jgi:hypothetical protein